MAATRSRAQAEPSPRGKRAAKVSRPTVPEASRTRTARLGSSPSSCFPLEIRPNHFIPQMTPSDGREAPGYINWGGEETPHPKQSQTQQRTGARGAFSGGPGVKNPLPGRVDTRVCTTESLGPAPETITGLLIGYAPTQNKKFKRRKKNMPCNAGTEVRTLVRELRPSFHGATEPSRGN